MHTRPPVPRRRRTLRALALVGLVTTATLGLLPPSPAAAVPSRCTTVDGAVSSTTTCPKTEVTLRTGLTGLVRRDVHYQTPLGTAPAGGWPAVVIWSPSIYSAELAWTGNSLLPAGAYHDTLQIKALLDNGFAVITPESHLEGFTFWDTNNPLTPIWSLAPDRSFTDTILSQIRRGRFGPIDSDRLFSTGMSSGGYMTSRMAVSYPGVFKALAVQSGSYATCLGPICNVPSRFTTAHAPTLFLHGTADLIVPAATMYPYRDRLAAAGVPTRTVLRSGAGHEFLPESPAEVVNWFRTYDPGP